MSAEQDRDLEKAIEEAQTKPQSETSGEGPEVVLESADARSFDPDPNTESAKYYTKGGVVVRRFKVKVTRSE